MNAATISAGRLSIVLRRSGAGDSGAVDEVATLLQRPVTAPRALLVLAHGAGADMRHRSMAAIADALCVERIATLRCNFPFKEHGRPRVDDTDTAVTTLEAAVAHAARALPGVPLLLGGHSFGGRMASHAAARGAVPDIRGLVFCSFPLHTAGKPAVSRAAHLPRIQRPMLFLSGTRDALAAPALLAECVAALAPLARLHWLHDADHSYATRQRERVGAPDVFVELAQTVSAWLEDIDTQPAV